MELEASDLASCPRRTGMLVAARAGCETPQIGGLTTRLLVLSPPSTYMVDSRLQIHSRPGGGEGSRQSCEVRSFRIHLGCPPLAVEHFPRGKAHGVG